MDSYEIFDLKNNTNSMNANGSKDKLVSFISQDISNLLIAGKSYSFQLKSIDSSDNIYTGEVFQETDCYKNAAKHTGFARAILSVYGYLQ